MLRQVLVSVAMLAIIALPCSIGFAGTVTDYSGNNNDGTTVGDVTTVTEGGISAFSFDGDGDYITVPNLGTGFSAGTVAAWVKFDDPFESPYHGWGSDWDDGVFVSGVWENGSFQVMLVPSNSNSEGFQIYSAARNSANGRSYKHTNVAPVAGQWYHVAFSFGVPTETAGEATTRIVMTDTSGNATVYTSGDVYNDTYTHNFSRLQFGGMAVSAGADVDSFLEGDMTDLRVYSEALSPVDIALLADASLATAPSSTNLLVHYNPATAAVPEPGTLVLLLGIALTGWLVRKK